MQAIQRIVQSFLPVQLASAMGFNGATAGSRGAAANSVSTSLRRALAKKGMAHDAPLTLGSFYFASERDLPPLLAPVPSLCRLLALLVVLPFVVVCMVDFAGYAIFRTLGFQRKRVRVKAKNSSSSKESRARWSGVGLSSTSHEKPTPTVQTSNGGNISPSLLIRAPVLQPGSYDADTLLRHRARSISGDSTEAEEEWARTGGSFARVSHVRAAQQAAAAAAAATSSSKGDASSSQGDGTAGSASYADAAAKEVDIPTNGAGTEGKPAAPRRSSTSVTHMSMTPPESPRQAFLNAGSIGVDGALGYFDTDAEEDSGAETPASGNESPEESRMRRRNPSSNSNASSRRGLKGASLGFTPVTPGGSSGGIGQSSGTYFGEAHSSSRNGAYSSATSSGTSSPVTGLGIASTSSTT